MTSGLAGLSASHTSALGDAFAVAAGSAGLLPRPSSSLSPSAEAAELLAEASGSGSDAPSLEAVAATGGSGLSSDSDAASALLAAADLPSEPSGSDTASHGDAFSDTVAATEALALGEGLAAPLEDIAALPREPAAPSGRAETKKATERSFEMASRRATKSQEDRNGFTEVPGDPKWTRNGFNVIIITIPSIIIPITPPKSKRAQWTHSFRPPPTASNVSALLAEHVLDQLLHFVLPGAHSTCRTHRAAKPDNPNSIIGWLDDMSKEVGSLQD